MSPKAKKLPRGFENVREDTAKVKFLVDEEKSRVVPATLERLIEFCSLEAIPCDRPIATKRQRQLTESIENGRARDFQWARALCKSTGKTYRVNGQHTSDLMRRGVIPINGFQISQTFYEVERPEDVFELWNTLDPPESNRTFTDVMKSLIIMDGRYTALNDKMARDICVALGMAREVANRLGDFSINKKAEVFIKDEYEPFIRWCFDVFQVIPKKLDIPSQMFYQKGVFYAAWVTYNWDHEMARKFWSETVAGNNPDRKSPTRLLFKTIDNGVPVSAHWNNVQWYDYVHFCLGAFNTFRGGKRIKELKPRYRRYRCKGLNHYIHINGQGRIKSFSQCPNKDWLEQKEKSPLPRPQRFFDSSVEETMRVVEEHERRAQAKT